MNLKQLRFAEACLVFLTGTTEYDKAADLSDLKFVIEYNGNLYTASAFYKVRENLTYSELGPSIFGESYMEKTNLMIDSDPIYEFLPYKTIKAICNSADLEIARYALLKYFIEKDVPEIDLPKTGNYLFNVENLSTGLKLPIMAVPEEAEFKLISINSLAPACI